jgi:hypothetical protein
MKFMDYFPNSLHFLQMRFFNESNISDLSANYSIL